MKLMKYNRSDRFPSFSTMIDDFFNRSFADLSGGTTHDYGVPAVNIKEDDRAYGLEVALPGFKKDDIQLSVEDSVLTIRSERKEEQEESHEGYRRREFGYRSFERSFTLPEIADQEHVEARFEDGVLQVSIPKMEKAELENRRTIAIR